MQEPQQREKKKSTPWLFKIFLELLESEQNSKEWSQTLVLIFFIESLSFSVITVGWV